MEIPIIKSFLKNRTSERLLEIGNVLSHYTQFIENSWTVVDLFEKQKGVVNLDVLDYLPDEKFDLIISVSTLEHIGLDDGIANKEKALEAMHHCINECLNNGGKFIFTIPIGYNKDLDRALLDNRVEVYEKHYLIRKAGNEWVEAYEEEATKKQYGYPYIYANATLIGIINK